MVDFFRKLFSTDFMPHAYCIRAAEVIWLHLASDVAIAVAYFIIPVGLVYFVRKRRDIVFPWMFWLFGLFILSCGATHVMAIMVLWHPVYRLEGVVKAITAAASLPTAYLLIRLLPQALQLPSPAQLRSQNEGLRREIAERERAEAEVRRLNEELERRVAERTAELERRNAELRASEEQFRHLANAIPQLCWMADEKGDIFWYNQRWYDYTGETLETMQGWGWRTVHDPAVLPSVMQNWTASLDSGTFFEMTFPLRGADGDFRPFLTRVVPVKDAEGRVTRWFGTNTDVSDQKKVETELRRANSDLEQFAYSASHDLKEPLRNVAVYSQLLEMRYRSQLEGDGVMFLNVIREGALRMESLVGDLLAYTQVGVKAEPAVEAVDANEVLAEVVTVFQKTIDETGATVRGGNLPRLRMGRTHLFQLLQNLVGNALKYRGAQRPEIVVTAERAEGQWVFAVRDNGIGMRQAETKGIFRIFSRLHTREQYPGTGVGLAICQRVVDHYNGRIWVRSEPGQGSTFSFSIPADRHA